MQQVDEDDAVIQSFVVPIPNADYGEVEYGEFASRTLSKLLRSFSAVEGGDLNLRKIMHEENHWVHDVGMFRRIVDQGAKHGVFRKVLRWRPSNIPSFLNEV